MSRSTKKPVWTQQNQGKPDKGVAKRFAAKAVRNTKLEETPAKGKAYRKVSNSWDIRDWAIAEPKNPKASRK